MPKLSKPNWLSFDPYVPQGEKFAPVLAQPDGKFLAPVHKRSDVTASSIIGRLGIVGVMDYDADASVQHGFHHAVNVKDSWANKTPGQSAQATRAEMRQAASQYPLYPVEGNDFGEGSYSFGPETQQALWWLERRLEMYQEANRIRRDYGWHGTTNALQGNLWYEPGGSQISPNSPMFRNRYASVAAARAGQGYFNTTHTSQGGVTYRYEDLVGCNVKAFAETPYYAPDFYAKLHAIEINGKAMGKVGGLGPGFLMYNNWSKIEGLEPPSNITNGNFYKRRVAGGIVLNEAHMQVDYDYQVGSHLIMGLMLSNGGSTFDLPVRYNPANPDHPRKFSGNDQWQPDNAGTPAPWDETGNGYFHEPCRWHDALLEAGAYHAQFDRTAGIGWSHLAYRFVGSQDWIEVPGDGASTLEHAAAFAGPFSMAQSARRGRPVVIGRIKNSAADFVAFDPSRGKMYREDIIVRAAPNREFLTTVQGMVPNAHRETI